MNKNTKILVFILTVFSSACTHAQIQTPADPVPEVHVQPTSHYSRIPLTTALLSVEKSKRVAAAIDKVDIRLGITERNKPANPAALEVRLIGDNEERLLDLDTSESIALESLPLLSATSWQLEVNRRQEQWSTIATYSVKPLPDHRYSIAYLSDAASQLKTMFLKLSFILDPTAIALRPKVFKGLIIRNRVSSSTPPTVQFSGEVKPDLIVNGNSVKFYLQNLPADTQLILTSSDVAILPVFE